MSLTRSRTTRDLGANIGPQLIVDIVETGRLVDVKRRADAEYQLGKHL
jgi:hypothetical protein